MRLKHLVEISPDDKELRIKQIEETIANLELVKSELLQELLEIDQF